MSTRFPKPIAKILTAIQALLPITQSEAVIVLVLLLGLTAGLVFKHLSATFDTTPHNAALRSEVLRLADSLANAERTTFVGTTPDAEPVLELATADTLVQKPLRFSVQVTPRTKSEKITSGKIRLNSATIQDLLRLPGVGKATAQKILEARRERAFKRIEDIMRVKGIGKKKFAAMQPFLAL